QTNAIATEIINNTKMREFDPRIPDDIAPWFSHIFDRDAQIRVIYQALGNARATNFNKRHHCLLWGRPACAKSEILLAFRKMLGEDNCVVLDATATTKAG